MIITKYLFIHVHKKKSSDLTHSLTVPNLGVVHRIGSQYMKQLLLFDT